MTRVSHSLPKYISQHWRIPFCVKCGLSLPANNPDLCCALKLNSNKQGSFESGRKPLAGITTQVCILSNKSAGQVQADKSQLWLITAISSDSNELCSQSIRRGLA
jgi:hypothetical protein